MKVQVWVADGKPTGALDYGTRLVEWYAGLGCDVVRVEWPDCPVPANDVDLHVFSGGEIPVSQNDGWMPYGLDMTHQLIAGDHRVLGVCLGSQMIAEVLKPGVIYGAPPIEVGVTQVRWNDGHTSIVPTFHYESISRDLAFRDNVTIDARNDRTPVHAFRFGDNVTGFQFHPEFSQQDVLNLLDYHHDMVIEYGGDPKAEAEFAHAHRPTGRLPGPWNY